MRRGREGGRSVSVFFLIWVGYGLLLLQCWFQLIDCVWIRLPRTNAHTQSYRLTQTRNNYPISTTIVLFHASLLVSRARNPNLPIHSLPLVLSVVAPFSETPLTGRSLSTLRTPSRFLLCATRVCHWPSSTRTCKGHRVRTVTIASTSN